MGEKEIETIMQDVNNWSVEDLRELIDQIYTFIDYIESDIK